MNAFWLITFFLTYSILGIAQEPYYWNLTESDGLPSMTIYDIVQDDAGYIWIGTSNGLCKYDGHEIITLPKKRLKDGEIVNLILDDDNRVWFSNLSGQLGCIENDSLKLFDNLISGAVFDFEIIGNFLYAHIKKSNMQNQIEFVKFEIDVSCNLINIEKSNELISKVSKICKVESNLFWISFRQEGKKFHIVNLSHNSKGLKFDETKLDISNTYSVLGEYENGLYLVDMEENILFILENDQLSEIVNLGENSINSFRNIEGNLFLLLDKGISIIKNRGIFNGVQSILENYSCNSIFYDQEKNFWISTRGDGLIVIPSPSIVNLDSQNSILSDDKVYCLLDDGEKILLGLRNSMISIVDTLNYSVESKKLKFSGKVTSMMKDKLNNYWFAIGNFCAVYNEEGTLKKKGNLSVKNIYEDKYGEVWISSTHGCFKLKIGRNLNTKANFKNPDLTYISRIRTYDFINGLDDKLWIGTSQGLNYYVDDSLHQFLIDDIPNNFSVADLSQAKDSVVWVATLEDGLIGIKNDKIVSRYNHQNGLSSNTCRKVLCDKNKIWIVTDKGINVINRNTKEIMIINNSDGLPTDGIEDILIKDDKVWLATMSGLVTFPKNINTHNSIPPPVHITSFRVWDKDTSFTSKLELSHEQNNIQVDFVGLGYRARGNVTYKYKLAGVDKDWVVTTSRYVRYPKLESGDYTFEVFAINEDGVESSLPASISFEIDIAWWNSWWFRVSTFLMIGFIGGSFLRFRWRVFREKEKFKDKVNELRQAALQTQMNPHFIFNSLNGVQKFITTGEEEKAINYLSSFANLVRMIFEHSKRKTISFDEEIAFLELYLKLEDLRFSDKVTSEIIIDEDVHSETYSIRIPPLLIQPIVENCFKHGLFHKIGRGKVTIHFLLESEYLICKIKDDGIGRKSVMALNTWKSKKHKSSGINTSRERLGIINGVGISMKDSLIISDLLNSRGEAIGTEVIMKINGIDK